MLIDFFPSDTMDFSVLCFFEELVLCYLSDVIEKIIDVMPWVKMAKEITWDFHSRGGNCGEALQEVEMVLKSKYEEKEHQGA